MSDNIMGERFLTRNGPAWHGIGVSNANITKAVTAVKKAKMDFNIVLADVRGVAPDGSEIVVPNKKMIVREPTHDFPSYEFFGFAGPDYQILQNMEIAKAMDILTDLWPVETVAALQNGKTMFITLEAQPREIKGEKIKQYFLVTDTRDGGTSLKIAFTGVRVVCWNTLVTGLKQASVSLSMDHTLGFVEGFGSRMNLVKRLASAQDKTMEAFKSLANYPLKKGELDGILAATYPLPNKPKKTLLLDEVTSEKDIASIGALYTEASESQASFLYYCKRAEDMRENVRKLFGKFNDEFPKTANTSWAAYQSVVEFADYRKSTSDDNVIVSSLFGPRAQEKKRAFSAAMAVVR